MTDRSNIYGNKPLNKPYTLAAIDYDGVLIDEKVSRKINKEAYERAILESERKGATFPRELREYSYSNLLRVKTEYPKIFLYYLYNVGNIIASDESIKKEKERIDAILKFVDKRLKADEKVVVTANFAAELTLRLLGYNIEVITVYGEKYIDAKSEAIKKLRENRKRENGDVHLIYVADTDEDIFVSIMSGAKFVHIKRILYEIGKS
ncbi:MAG: hypothetical protein RQ930_02255 [Candidatus Aenigmarchaeota archaeon]|jgi:ribosomal protein L31E|nr:hypothetical protein [Candidatus Aenigmarchaeota archaeon]